MNPWEQISLSDYENHMSLGSVLQLQTLNQIMKEQFENFNGTKTIAVLGVAGGNGIEHIRRKSFEKVYGIDINADYLKEVEKRFADLHGILECKKINLITEADILPESECVIANLLIEYIGYDAFKNVLGKMQAKKVSCVIQINESQEQWVSDSPYIHVFDGLDSVHTQVTKEGLVKCLNQYKLCSKKEYPLPNGKKLVMLDFCVRIER